ncbi:MAG: HNH endonuclease [Chitinophagales bacterium]|nr:HNH endonuclease [Chitinophagales bacterium]
MHFVDRTLFLDAPLADLAAIEALEKPKWLAYKNWINTGTGTRVVKPSGKWTHDSIRNPLTNLFKNNCAYCGGYSDKQNDGEVDHFFPKEKDTTGDYIYNWDNYVWACHSCNNLKNDNYPLINPCNKSEMAEIYFHHSDGRYLIKAAATQDLQDKYKLTDLKTFINGKIHPKKRLLISKQLSDYLSEVHWTYEILELEELTDPRSADTQQAFQKHSDALRKTRAFFSAVEYVLLKKQIFEEFKVQNPVFPYIHSDFE